MPCRCVRGNCACIWGRLDCQEDCSSLVGRCRNQGPNHVGSKRCSSPHFFSHAQSPFIKVFVLRIGDVEAMVDTGAKNSIISEEILRGRSAFQIRPSESAWCSVNRQNLPAHGETSLSVRFKESIVDLKRVVAMRDVMYPLVLGVDWITTSGVIISTRNGQLMVDVPAASAPILQPKSTRIESQVEKEEDFESASEDIRLLGAVAASHGDSGNNVRLHFSNRTRGAK